MSDSQLTVCPQCDTINRVPQDKNTLDAKCGGCHQKLLDGIVIELSEERFQSHVSNTEIPLVIDFWAEWCGPCKAMAPIFVQAARELAGTIRFAKIDTDTYQRLAGQYNIRGIPTLVVFKSGRELARQSGAMDLKSLKQWLARACA